MAIKSPEVVAEVESPGESLAGRIASKLPPRGKLLARGEKGRAGRRRRRMTSVRSA